MQNDKKTIIKNCCRTKMVKGSYVPCSGFDFSADWHAMRHSCSSGEGISPADPPAVSWRACHQ